MSADPVFKAGIDEQQAWIRQYVRDHGNDILNRPTAALYTIPVVVHIIHTGAAVGTTYNPTDAQIQSAINYLNQVYEGTLPGIEGVGEIQINFALATRDENCNPTTGITRTDGSGIANYTALGVNANNTTGVDETTIKNLVRWDPYRYYNIWVVNRIDSKDGTSGSFIGGFAYFPGAPPTLDGTILLATQMQTGRKTLPHEIGHAFSLYHPFEGSSGATCPTNADCANEGDEICDTDPITLPAGFVCRTGTQCLYRNTLQYQYGAQFHELYQLCHPFHRRSKDQDAGRSRKPFPKRTGHFLGEICNLPGIAVYATGCSCLYACYYQHPEHQPARLGISIF